jgi:imidazolonepropionase-like amidohydrolase
MRSLPSIALTAAIFLPATATSQESSYAIVGVSVVPMDSPRIVANQTVVVRNGRIVELTSRDGATIPVGATLIDGDGKFLIPGLAEMHAHVPPGQQAELLERVLTLFIVNGVTSIRGMLGDPSHLGLRQELASGARLGPRLVTSGPSFNANSARTVDAAVTMVAAQKEAGYDFLKIHPGVPRPVFDSLAAAANRLRIRFAGHVPLEVGLQRALEARYATIDHLDGFLEALLPESAPIRPTQANFGIGLVAYLDESRISAVARAVAAAGVAIVPTQGFLVGQYGPAPAESLLARPEMRYWPKAQLEQWATAKRAVDRQYPAAVRSRFLELRRRAIAALHSEGATILLGSDAPQLWDVPGFSIHRELRYYVEAGLTPFQALATGTVHVARFLGWEDSGTIAVGKRADLVLLDGNPLQDIGNTQRIAGVMIGGRWLDRSRIAELLRALERSD